MKKKRRTESKDIETGSDITSRVKKTTEPLPFSKKIILSSSLETIITTKTSEREPKGWLDRATKQYYPHATLNSARGNEIRDDIKYHLDRFLDSIQSAIKKPIPLSKLKDLVVLDLACGSEKAERASLMEHPNLCRALKVLGCKVVGVDKYYPRYNDEGKGIKEDWQFVKLDLVKPGALREVFSENTFDIINTDYFICHRGNLAATSPSLAHQLVAGRDRLVPSNQKYRALEDILFEQVLRLLKPGGVFIVNGFIYKKVGFKKTDGSYSFTFEDLSPPQTVSMFENYWLEGVYK